MAKNFRSGSRDMKKSVGFALKDSVELGFKSHSTAGTQTARFNKFVKELKEYNPDIKKLEDISVAVIIDYGQELAHRVAEGELAASTAQNYISAINSVMNLATHGRWGSISPTKDCGIPKKSQVRITIPASLDRVNYTSCLNSISVYFGERAAAIVSLCRELGLRSKEASLANARKLLSEALSKNEITVIGGTKGGRKRTIPITSTEQIEALKLAATVQGKDKSMIPSDQSWRSWREGGLRKIREAVQKFLGATGLHDLRAGYACQRYTELTGFNSPLLPGPHADKKTDLNARKIIAEELGHSRTQIMNSYIGGRKYVVV